MKCTFPKNVNILVDSAGPSKLEILSHLAFPLEQLRRDKFIILARRYLQLAKEEEHEDLILLRVGLRRIMLRRLPAAVMTTIALEAVEAGGIAPDLQQALQDAAEGLTATIAGPQGGGWRERLRLSPAVVEHQCWRETQPILPLAMAILTIIQKTQLTAAGLLVSDGWSWEVIAEAEINRRRLYQRPVLGCAPPMFTRFLPSSGTVVTSRLEGLIDLFGTDPINTAMPLTYQPIASPARVRIASPKCKIFDKPLEIHFVKPVRDTDSTPTFDWVYGGQIAVQKLRATILPDANVLARLQRFVEKASSMRDIEGTGLDRMCKQLAEGPTAFFSPALAIQERGSRYAKKGKKALDLVLASMVPDLIDEEMGGYEGPFFPSETPYRELPTGFRLMVGPTYLVLLRARLLRQLDIHPAAQFIGLLDYAANRLDMVGALEVDIVKHTFFDYKGPPKSLFLTASKAIAANFPARAKTASGTIRDALNAARDVGYIQAALNRGGQEGDVWLLTQDAKVKALFDTIRFEPERTGVASKNMAIVQFPERMNSYYWREVDGIHTGWVEARQERSRKRRTDVEWLSHLDACISESEEEIRATLPK